MGPDPNTSYLTSEESMQLRRKVKRETGVPCMEPLRGGADLVVNRLALL